jgi:hypothetical protein
VSKLTRKMRLLLWELDGRFSRRLSLDSPQKVTVLITYYHPVRMQYVDSQIRNILKCAFVEKLVISNHNADIRIQDKVSLQDERLVFMNQKISRTCGYRWRIAKELDSEYIIAIDDDILLFPSQLKKLFQHLIQEPEIPHGFSGMLHLKNDEFQFREREELVVHFLCEIYAVTKEQVRDYFEIETMLIEKENVLPDVIERYGDFIVISQTGIQNPKIHNGGRLMRSNTFKTSGVANHKDDEFTDSVVKVSNAVERIRNQSTTQIFDKGSTSISTPDYAAG